MKKLYTLAVAALTFFCASAQTAPDNDVNLDEWTYLGEGVYNDGIVYNIEMSGYAQQTFPIECPVYQNKANENQYLFYDVYPASFLEMTYYTTKDGDTPSTVTFTVDGESVSMEIDFHLLNQNKPQEFTVTGTGTNKDGVFSFPAGTISAGNIKSLAFTAQLPAGDEGGDNGDEGDDNNDVTQDIDLNNWELLGEAEYTDGIIYAIWRNTTYKLDPYNVLSYRNKENPNQFLLANVYPAEELEKVRGNGVALRDNKASNLILTVDPTTKEVTAQLNSTLYFNEEEGSDQDITITASGTKGTFNDGTITLPERTFVMDSWGGYHNPSNPVTIKFPEGTELIVGETAKLTITVKNEAGEPLADATVNFNNEETTTDENGQAVFANIDPSEVTGKEVDFTVLKDGYEFYEGKADFTKDLDATAEVTLEATIISLTVTVMDADYEFVADATVTFNGETYTTNENGRVVIPNLSAPEYIGKEMDITVSKTGYITYNGTVIFENLKPTATITLEADNTTGIAGIAADATNGEAKVYDLTGRRVAAPAAGNVYIVNGVKVLVK
ncbi:MAG: hypothetical protein K2L14_08375 [Duncaniella sp.]|nr:hypothetical protein [Duncaniella sp.]